MSANHLNINTLYTNYVRDNDIRCNCGNLCSADEHSPDCNLNLAWDKVVSDYDAIADTNAS